MNRTKMECFRQIYCMKCIAWKTPLNQRCLSPKQGKLQLGTERSCAYWQGNGCSKISQETTPLNLFLKCFEIYKPFVVCIRFQ